MLNRVISKNFQSWKDMTFDFKKGVTLIDGWNEDDQTSEGSGKSSILNSVAWCIYGKLPKDAKVDDVVKHGESTCSVELQFGNGDSIIRSRKPNDIYLRKSNGNVIKGKDAKETQELIEEYVGCNFETFCQSTYFAQNYDKKFLTSNQEDRGKILSGIQNLQIFDKARKEVMDLLKKESDTLSTYSRKLELEENSMKHMASRLTMLEDFIARTGDAFEATKKSVRQKIEYTINELASYERSKLQILEDQARLTAELGGALDTDGDTVDALKAALNEVLPMKSQLKAHNSMIIQQEQSGRRSGEKYNKLSEKKIKLEEFLRSPTSECPTCGTTLTNVDTSHTSRELDEVISEMNDLLTQMTEIGNYLDANKAESAENLDKRERDLRASIFEIESRQNKAKLKQKEIDRLKYNLTAVETNIASKQLDIGYQEQALVELKPQDLSKELDDKEKLITAINLSAEGYANVQDLKQAAELYVGQLEQLKEGFREIKSYVFNNALSELNFRVNKYLNDLFEVSASLKFTTEDQKIETRVTIDNRETGLGLLSGGQNRRFNLAVDLALADIVAHRKTSKLDMLILDEYFKDLSEVSMEKCLDLLKSRKSPVLIIEHNTIFKNIVDNTFFVRLENGTSYESRQ